MALFQTSVLKKYLRTLDSDTTVAAYARYKEYFQDKEIQKNIRKSKEEQFQEGFLRELFVNVLGYTINPSPNFNLTTEFKNLTGAKKADGAILQDGKALGIIELKSTKTKDLESIRQQAFNYKANQDACKYVVTSNFERLRFYIDNSGDFEEFNLFYLDKTRFDVLYLCLSYASIANGTPEKIKRDSLIAEENVTKELYKDYSDFKRELFDDIAIRNIGKHLPPDKARERKKLLFKKTQKLLDRFLFVFFAEDRGLLDPNTIAREVANWERLKDLDEYRPLYDRYKKLFEHINTGFESKDYQIFEFNGGLFREDLLLDGLVIDDDMLKEHTLKLTAYDFETEVDVNILGHIFEHSLGDIEDIHAEIDGVEKDKKKSRRKKEGVYYTPKYITKYIVDNTLGALCAEKRSELGIVEDEYVPQRRKKKTGLVGKLDIYRAWLLDLTIVDPACGSGAFLIQALDFLIQEHRNIDELKAQLYGEDTLILPEVENTILERNIFGVDINDEAVDIAKLSLWLHTAKKGRKLSKLNDNIKCGNSLIDDPAIAGDKAFNWEKEFPHVFAQGGFDVVIGNPPYVTYHGRRRTLIQDTTLNYYKHNYACVLDKSIVGKYNSAMFFIEQFVRLCKPFGTASCITDISFYENFYQGVKKYLLENTNIMHIVNGLSSFKDVGSGQLILVVQKTASPPTSHIVNWRINGLNKEEVHVDQAIWYNQQKGFQFYIEDSRLSKSIITKFQTRTQPLDFYFPNKLIRTGESVGTKELGFVIEECPVTPEVEVYEYLEGANSLAFGYAHLVPTRYFRFDTVLLNQRNTQYRLEAQQRQRKNPKVLGIGDKKAFDNPKILIRQSCDRLCCTYTAKKYVYNRSYYSISNENSSGKSSTNLLYVLGLLNSKLFTYYARQTRIIRMERGKQPQIRLSDLKSIPVCMPSFQRQTDIIKRVQTLLGLNEAAQQNKRVNSLLIQREYNLQKIPKKLQKFHELEFNEFVKALKVKGLSLSQKKDIMTFFEAEKTKMLALKQEIDRIDKKIDQIVYQLYGLTEDEISLVENSV